MSGASRGVAQTATTTQAAQVVTSSDGTTRKLQAATPPPFAPLAEVGAQPVVVDIGVRYQEMTGFGASVTDSTAFSFTRRMSASQRAAILQEMFGPAPTNMGLSFIRISIGASDFSPTEFTYDDQPFGGTDYGLFNFSVTKDEEYRIAVLQQILAINPQVKIMASPWSAPAWMKLDPSVGIGPSSATNNKLDPVYRIAYANYLVKFVQAYARFGINVWAISIQNEPEAGAQGFPCMAWTSSEQIDFIKNYLGPAFDAAGLKTRILGYDDAWRTSSAYALALLGDTTVAGYLAGIAWHWYIGDPSIQRDIQRRYPLVKQFLTEFCEFPGGPAGTMANFMKLCYIGSVRYGSSAVCNWNLARDLTNADNNNGYGAIVHGVLSVDATTGAVTRNTDYYALGHTSKYVMPGAVRVRADSYDAAVQTVAYENPDESIALVCFNAAATSQTFQIIDARRNQGFAVTLPAGETATFTWRGFPAGTGSSALTVPGAPTSLTATAARGGVNLSWAAPSSGAPLSGYRILSGSSPGGEAALVALVDPAQTTWSDPNASTSAATYYTVQAVNGGGAGTASNEASATALAPVAPGAPSIALESDGTAIGVVITPGSDNGAGRTNFTIYRATTSGGQGSTPLVTLNPGVTFYKDTGVSAGTTYYYTAKQTNTIGTSSASAEQSRQVGAITPSVGAPLVDINPTTMGLTDGQTTRTLTDSSGNAHHATINALFDPVTYRATGVDSAPALESVDTTGKADFGDLSALLAGGGTFVWRGELADSSYSLFSHRNTVGSWQFGGTWSIQLWIARIALTEQFQKTGGLTSGVHTIAIRADGTTYEVRVDGTVVGTQADITGGYLYDAGNFYALLGPTPFAGKTKRALVYSRRLRDAEIIAVEAAVGPPAVAPQNTVAPAISGTTTTGQTISCSTGTWTGTAPITYAYQWKRNGSNISGATSSTYLLAVADEGQSVKCTVTATNSVGSASADSNTVTPSAPLFDPGTLSPVAWYKPETLSALSDGASVTSWPDSSGNSHAAANGNSSQQPIYKTAIQNGKAVVRFDGTNDILSTGAFTLNRPTHIFIVCVWRTSTADSTAIDGVAAAQCLIRQQGTRTINLFAGADLNGPASVTDVWRQYAILSNSTTSEIRVDGGSATTGNAGTQNAGGIVMGARSGPSSPGAVDIGEVIVFSSALNTTDRQNVEGYLRARWGTA